MTSIEQGWSLLPLCPQESLKLSEEQRWQLLKMREQCKDIILTAKSAHTCSMDMAAELARRTPTPALYSTSENVNFLDIGSPPPAFTALRISLHAMTLIVASHPAFPLQSRHVCRLRLALHSFDTPHHPLQSSFNDLPVSVKAFVYVPPPPPARTPRLLSIGASKQQSQTQFLPRGSLHPSGGGS